jgi:N-acyl-D-amino-acid deacylase
MNRLRIAPLTLAVLGVLALSTTGWALDTSTLQTEPDRADPTCSFAGDVATIDGGSQCVCQAGYSGPSCESCAAGFERDASGACILGATARRSVCYDKGTPYLDRFGGIACRCDAGFTGPDCGGPPIKVEGADRSVNAGGKLVLHASGGSGSYRWSLVTPRGSLSPVDRAGTSQVYNAPSDVKEVEIVRLKVTDTKRHVLHEFPIAVAPTNAIAITGIPVDELVSFDQAMLDYMKGRGIRAGVLAVAKDGQIVLSRGYGFMDKGADADPFVHDEGGTGLVGPKTPMRIASITKPITAAAVREALAAQQLDTALPALPFVNASLGVAQVSLAELQFPFTPNGAPYYVETDLTPAYQNCLSLPDPRWDDLTIQHLLAHEGGFNRDLSPSPRWSGGFVPPPSQSNTSYNPNSGDPNFKPAMMLYDLETATGLDFTGPLRPKALVQYMAGLCLAFTPGTQSQKYSNFGYTLLGRVLEALHDETWSPGDGANRREGWGPYISIVEDFLAGHGVTGIRAGGTGSFTTDNHDQVGGDEPYYRHLAPDGTEYFNLNVGDAFGVVPEGGMHFPEPQLVPTPYGGFSMQTMESHGGLVATAPALLKFMRHFRLRPSDWGDIGVPRGGTNVGNAAHGGLLPGTYALAWQVKPGSRTVNVPVLTGAWDQASESTLVVTTPTSCTLPTGIDVVALFAQSRDPKDDDVSEYGRLPDFLGKAACQVTTWPNPLAPSTDFQIE